MDLRLHQITLTQMIFISDKVYDNMPTYEYICDNSKCCYNFEIHQSMADDSLVECPECGNETLRRKIFTPFCFVKGEPKTVGHIASRNTENMGRYEYDDRIAQRKNRVRKASDKLIEETGAKNIEHTGELPWWRSGKVPGLPREEKPITIEKAKQIAKELDINIKEAPKKCGN
jgi:putative FmdB family regulatory protein